MEETEEIFTCGECGKQFKVYIVFCEHELTCNGIQEDKIKGE